MKKGAYLRRKVRGARRRRSYAKAHPKRFDRTEIRVLVKTENYYEAALRAFRKLLKKPYPHLSGDLDADADVLAKLEAVARDIGQNIYVTSGLRSFAEQQALWDRRFSNPFPVARPGTSRHESGRALDALVRGRPIQTVVSAETLRKHGLSPLSGDAVHVEG